MEELGIFRENRKRRKPSDNSSKVGLDGTKTFRLVQGFKDISIILSYSIIYHVFFSRSEVVDEKASTIVVAIVENRAREICICKIDTSLRCIMEVFLITDSHSYNETIITLHGINPDEVIYAIVFMQH